MIFVQGSDIIHKDSITLISFRFPPLLAKGLKLTCVSVRAFGAVANDGTLNCEGNRAYVPIVARFGCREFRINF